MIKIGFTGTRQGMTDAQHETFEKIIREAYSNLQAKEFHHGDCIGADDEAHDFVDHSIGGVFMHVHPCNLFRQRAYKTGDVEYDELPPLTRNKIIVETVDAMIATPSGFDELSRGSGTWATIRHARRTNKPLVIIYPDGSFTEENR